MNKSGIYSILSTGIDKFQNLVDEKDPNFKGN